ncbi:hypothetical protein CMV_026603 [Castanea mollissima]|uniref:Photosystem I assembly protein Ycf3 n=1 Tax=Castanea mollissima TaxID=60419 RepID=A0A8J4Q7P0_9ROSI|nr:hypothetical protein CMV_026603 [Castanea mollissima]
MCAQSSGEYAEALQNYYQAMRFETDPYDRSYILYNIGLIHTSNGEHGKALEYYYQALERNPSLPQALNNVAVIYHYRGEQAVENGQSAIAVLLFDKAADYWKEAIRLAPTNYIEAEAKLCNAPQWLPHPTQSEAVWSKTVWCLHPSHFHTPVTLFTAGLSRLFALTPLHRRCKGRGASRSCGRCKGAKNQVQGVLWDGSLGRCFMLNAPKGQRGTK